MVEYSNKINKSTIEVEITSREKVETIQDRLSLVFNGRLQEEMDRVFSKYSLQDKVISIDQLSLDIGRVNERYLEEEFVEKVIKSLEEKLHELQPVSSLKKEKQEEERLAELEYLKHFLLYGYLPWQVSNRTDLQQLIGHVITHHAAGLLIFLKNTGTNPYVRRRIAWQFSEPSVRRVIETIAPAHAPVIMQYVKELEKNQQEDKMVQASSGDFKKAVYAFVLHYLLAEKGVDFNARMFTRSVLKQMAAHYNVAYHTLLFHLGEALAIYKKGYIRGSLLEVIEHIYAEDLSDVHVLGALSKNNTGAGPASERIAQSAWISLFSFFQKGYFPSPAFAWSRTETYRLMEQLLETSPAIFERFFRSQQNPVVVERITRFFPAHTVQRVVTLITGKEQGWTHTLGRHLVRLNAQQHFIRATEKEILETVSRGILLSALSDSRNIDQEKLMFHLLTAFEGSWNKSPQEVYPAMARMFPGIAADNVQEWLHRMGQDSQAAKKITDAYSEDERTAIVKFYLLNGKLPSWSHQAIREKEIRRWFDEAVSGAGRTEILSFLQTNVNNDVLRKNVLAIKKTADAYSADEDERTAIVKFYLLNGKLPWWSHQTIREKEIRRWFDQAVSGAGRTEILSFLQANINNDILRKNVLAVASGPVLTGIFSDVPGTVSQIRDTEWVSIQQKLTRTHFDLFREIHLLHAFLGREKEYLVGSAVDKIYQRYGIDRSSFRMEMLKLGKIFPNIFYSDFLAEMMLTEGSDEAGKEKPREDTFASSEKETVPPPANPVDIQVTKPPRKTAAEEQQRQNDVFNMPREKPGSAMDQEAELYLDALNDYLIKGSMPFYFSGSFSVLLESLKPYKDHFNGSLVRVYALSSLKDAVARKRFFENFNHPDDIAGFLEIFFHRQYQFLKKYLSDLRLIFAHPVAGMPFQLNETLVFDLALLFLLQQGTRAFSAADFMAFVFREMPLPKNTREQFFMQVVELAREQKIVMPAVISHFLLEIRSMKQPEKPKRQRTEEEKPVVPEAGVFIENAGAVILWPFLIHYYQQLQLLNEEKQFRDEKAACRAAYLLQYLVTGIEEHGENKLVLNKVLCGIKQNEPLEQPEPFTQAEMDLTESLLKAVIGQWEIIKNTSVQGLRETFLHREGKLEFKEDKFNLTVKNGTFDMLVEKIPWGMSMIKLPWMKLPLYVKWR